MGKVLAAQLGGTEWNPKTHVNPDVVVHPCNSSFLAAKWEERKSSEASEPVSLVYAVENKRPSPK